MKKNDIKFEALHIAIMAVLVPAAVAAVIAGTAVAVGAANAWFLERTFAEGWHAVWSKPVVAIAWTLLFGAVGGWISGRTHKNRRISSVRRYSFQ
jgi:hypothetical protein